MNTPWLLGYPVWDLDVFGGGFWIAFMAVIHVFIAHFAVGGGLFVVLTEMKSYRENSPDMLAYTRKHARFFLLLTVVLGSVTGVGIWFVISVLSPTATSTLVHYFVFGWATEWLFFLAEIVVLFLYYYTFEKIDRRHHLQLGWLYFIFGWLSLFVINGIVAFMLTPGDWLATRDFWDGIFNPAFWPSTAFRTAMAFMLAGLFGFVTALSVKKPELRERLMMYCAKWLLIPLGLVLAAGAWYIAALPEAQKMMILERSPEALRYLRMFLWISPVIFVVGVLLALRTPLGIKRGLAAVLVLIGLAYMGAFEWTREAGRRPYIIRGYTYSNSIQVADAEAVREAGVLKAARWVDNREITEANALAAGEEIFRLLCSACHSVGGPMNDILPRTKKFTVFGMDAMLNGIGKINTYMPPFLGTGEERQALATYIVQGLHGKAETKEPAASVTAEPVEIPAFDEKQDEYILLAWSEKGMHCISDSDAYFSFSFPGNALYAQLIRRGESPEKITEGVTLTYRIQEGFQGPARQVEFWKYSKSLTGKEIPENTGLSGKSLSGDMDLDPEKGIFTAQGVPVVPYPDKGEFHPYPLATVEARDADGTLLVDTQITAPVSTEMNCKLCHGGEWRVAGQAGLSAATAEDILTVHDRMNRTDLKERAEDGNPVRCQECHGGKPEHLNLSAAIHGFHANYLTDRWAEACAACHPGSPDGVTHAYRGIHKQVGIDCISCHGTLEDLALSLLTAEKAAGKAPADRLMAHLKPRVVESVEKVKPRQPWVNEPDCLNCHIDYQVPEVIETFNQWTRSEADLYRNRSGDAGVMCAGCHGITHALYPATNPFGHDRDNIPPMQYQSAPYPMGADKNCKVCHTVDMEFEMHHPNSLRMFRNIR